MNKTIRKHFPKMLLTLLLTACISSPSSADNSGLAVFAEYVSLSGDGEFTTAPIDGQEFALEGNDLGIGVDYKFSISPDWSVHIWTELSSGSADSDELRIDKSYHASLGVQARYWFNDLYLGLGTGAYYEKYDVDSISPYINNISFRDIGPGISLLFGWESKSGWLAGLSYDKTFTDYSDAEIENDLIKIHAGYRWRDIFKGSPDPSASGEGAPSKLVFYVKSGAYKLSDTSFSIPSGVPFPPVTNIDVDKGSDSAFTFGGEYRLKNGLVFGGEYLSMKHDWQDNTSFFAPVEGSMKTQALLVTAKKYYHLSSYLQPYIAGGIGILTVKLNGGASGTGTGTGLHAALGAEIRIVDPVSFVLEYKGLYGSASDVDNEKITISGSGGFVGFSVKF